jgi:NAD(P)H-nitrite reductase large subunit
MSEFLVNRCICHKKSFEEIKEYAQENGITRVEELQSAGFSSNSCKMCKPYIELMFETGETSFKPGAYYGRKSAG